MDVEMRSLRALMMWKRFMVGLQIKERIDGYDIEGEEGNGKPLEEAGQVNHDQEEMEAVEDDSGMESEEYIDDGGGGFFPE